MASFLDSYQQIINVMKSRASRNPDKTYSLKLSDGKTEKVFNDYSAIPDPSVVLTDYFPDALVISYEMFNGKQKIKSGRMEVKEPEPEKKVEPFDKLMEFLNAQREVSKFVEVQKDQIFNERVKAIEDRFLGLMEQQKSFFEKQIDFQNEMSRKQLQIEIDRKTFELEKKYDKNEPNVFEQLAGSLGKFVEALPPTVQESLGELVKNYAMAKMGIPDLANLNDIGAPAE